jgi:Flp pilus assembly protein TadD
MYFTLRGFLPVLLLVSSPLLPAQSIRVTIPRHSALTPVQRLNREGVEEVVKRRYEKAETLFNKAYLFDPTDPFTLTNLGYISELQGQADRAENFYKLAVEQGCYANIDLSSAKNLKNKPMVDALGTINNLPMRINRMNVMAMRMLAQGRAFDAISLLEGALALDPANPFTLNDLGVAEEAIGDVESALRYYDRSTAIHSKDPIIVTLNRSFRGKPISQVAAESAYDLRVRTQDRTPDQLRASMLTLRGVTAVNGNDWITARQSFVDAYTLDPHSAFTLNNLGYLAEHDGDLELAKAYYSGALNARGANERVGLTTQPSAEVQKLAALAVRSEQEVDGALAASGERRHRESGPVVLKRRRVEQEPGKPVPNQANPDKNVPDSPAPPLPPQ